MVLLAAVILIRRELHLIFPKSQNISSGVNVFKLDGQSLRKNDRKFKLVEVGIERDSTKITFLDITICHNTNNLSQKKNFSRNKQFVKTQTICHKFFFLTQQTICHNTNNLSQNTSNLSQNKKILTQQTICHNKS